MLYKRLERKRKPETERDEGERAVKRPRRGTRFTLLSFLVIGICLVFIKISNPGADMRAPILMLVTVGLACVVMSYVSRRM
ncbi:MAG: hypothetical protein LBS45_04715 [Synergistaceae bacterium]|jgi:hypothetical protein|nr:hypothetical protein [Synergistaceae bacterium]